MRIATVFSGIGAFETALEKKQIDYEITFACDTGERCLKQTYEEILQDTKLLSNKERNEYIKELYSKDKKPNYVKKSYFANHKIKEENWFEDVRFIDGTKYKDKIDFFVGGSPCQSFSINGKRAGLNDARGTLFYDYARLVKEMQPKVFIYENVPGMLSHDKGKTWAVIKDVFQSLGYKTFYSVLNSRDYGIPQDRKRLFVVGFKNKAINFEFPKPELLLNKSKDLLEENVDSRHYLGEKGFKFVTNPKNCNRARIGGEIIHTEKANQQFNWNGDFVFVPKEKIEKNMEIMNRAYIGNYNGEIGAIRQLSYRECLRFMGFPDSFKIVVPNIQAYRQAGNSIVVNVLEKIIDSIYKTGVFDES